MRRWASIVLFVIGGFCVGMQVMIGFMHVPADYPGRELPPLVEFTAIPIPFLAAGTWLSPGRRWRELGMTMLIGAAVCVGSFAITIGSPVEEGGTGGLGPLAGYVDWTQGWVNAAVVATTGLALLVFDRWQVGPRVGNVSKAKVERGEIMKGNAPWPVMIVAVVIIVAAFATFGALWSGSEQGKALAAVATSSYESSWLPWAAVAVAIGCGVGMVLGWPMARLLFVAWMGWGVIEGLFWLEERHFNLAVTLVYAAIAVLLFLPASNAWFRSDRAAEA